ncbi:MAG TPA: hypothetical protein PLR22_09380 [Saprospiraceae bacterium]|nr:hypothetical protein [Saprospiraceae bacterium]
MKKRYLPLTALLVIAAYIFTMYNGLNDSSYQAYIAQREYENSLVADNDTQTEGKSGMVIRFINGVIDAVTMIDKVVK